LTEENISFLKKPLYGLCYAEDIDDYSGLTKKDLESLINEYEESEIIGIVESVNWTTKNQNYDLFFITSKFAA